MNRIASFEQQFRQEIAVLTADSCYQYFFAQRLNAIAIVNAARQRFSWHEGVPSLASQAVLAGRIEKKVEVSQELELGSAFAFLDSGVTAFDSSLRCERRLVRVDGIEPTQPAWKAGVLQLNYTREKGGLRSNGWR